MAQAAHAALTRALIAAVEQQQPPRAGMARPKLRYAHQGGNNPPLIIIHGTALDHVPDSYRRYLEHFFSRRVQTARHAASGPIQDAAPIRTRTHPARRKGRCRPPPLAPSLGSGAVGVPSRRFADGAPEQQRTRSQP